MNWDFLSRFSGAHLLVAGEVGIDEYLWGDTRRISPEAPVPVVEVESQSSKLGLAANVAQNVVSLGAKTTLISVCGEDADGQRLSRMLTAAGVHRSELLVDPSRPTLRKVRVIAQKQQLLRVDYERVHVLDAILAKRFIENICDTLPQCDGVIVQDYGKGLWNSDTMSFVKRARELGKPVFVDPNRSTPAVVYEGVTLLTPNVVEAEALCGMGNEPSKVAGRNDERLRKMAAQLLERTHAEHVVITCGEWGMVSSTRGTPGLERIPTFARDVFDVTGAGDTVIAALSLMSVLGYPLAECIRVANAAAGIVVGHIGTASVTPQELKAELERLQEVGLIKN